MHRHASGVSGARFLSASGHPMFLSLAHSEQDIEDTIVAVEESIADLDS